METASWSRSGAGGKIVSDRRMGRIAAVPYDRTPLPPPPKSPNWLSGAILHSALTLASGAGKILSSVLLSDSSSSSEHVDSASENDAVDVNDNEIPSHEVDKLSRKNGTSLQMIKDRQESQFSARKSIIEQLIMHETFSREECDRLINIVNSRVMDYSTIEAGENGLHTDALRDIVRNETVDLDNKDVMEAKIWFEEKKMGLNAGSDLAHGTCELNSAAVQPKQNSLSSGSWNIQEELQRVRLKATEDMLCYTSSKIDLSLFAVAPKSGQESLGFDILAAGVGEKMIEPKEPKPIDASLNLDAGVGADPGVLAMNWLSGNQRRWHVSDKVNKENKRAAELKQERELKRLESSINYDGRKEQRGESKNPSTV
ncbi:Protein KAKU4 [Forsythia ovata]|uniref:Protein KAKU4 n=1 Tax=Forsythia ovata TaxID=205694 RepID=A0ABD1RNA3_9LAMI